MSTFKSPFELIKHIINNKDYSNIDKNEKKKHRFMVNRLMAIQFPLAAQKLNIKGYDDKVVDSWGIVLKKFNNMPNWLFIKTKKDAENKKKRELPDIDENIINKYLECYKIARKDLVESYKLYPKELEKDLKDFSKQINVSDG